MGANRRLFVDMDGTLAVFRPVDRLETLYQPGYFRNLEPHQNVVEAIKEILRAHADLEVFTLSAYLSNSKYALEEKQAWLDEHLPELDAAHRLFVPCGEEKASVVPSGISAQDFLLDDYTLNLMQWCPPGSGIKFLNGINHTRGTWKGDCVSIEQDALKLSQAIARIASPPTAAPTRRRENSMAREKKLHFTDEQYNIARHQSSALAYALQHNYPLVKKGAHYYHKEHDSMVFTENGHWFWNSRGLNGGAIELLQYYEGKTLPEAVLTLCGENGISQSYQATPVRKTAPEQKADFSPPVNGKNYKQLFGYLVAGRGLDKNIIQALVKSDLIYPTTYVHQGKTLHNAVFVGQDENGIVRSAFARGCGTYSTFKMESPGSDKRYPFRIDGHANATQLMVFEGAIDALSHATIENLSNQDWQACHRIAQGGNAPIEALTNFLAAHPQVHTVTLCMDSDKAGNVIAQQVSERLREAGWEGEITRAAPPSGKDWNDYLKLWRETVAHAHALTTQEHIGSEQESCGRIHLLNEQGAVEKTASYHDKNKFREHSKSLLQAGRPVIIETPQQLEELALRAQKKSAQQQSQSMEIEVG